MPYKTTFTIDGSADPLFVELYRLIVGQINTISVQIDGFLPGDNITIRLHAKLDVLDSDGAATSMTWTPVVTTPTRDPNARLAVFTITASDTVQLQTGRIHRVEVVVVRSGTTYTQTVMTGYIGAAIPGQTVVAPSDEAFLRAAGDATVLGSARTYADGIGATGAAARAAADSAEATTRASADSSLQTNITTEAAARVSGDASTLSSAQSYADTKAVPMLDEWGKDPATSVGLTWGYKAGTAITTSGAQARISSGTTALTNNATNYVERTYAGVVSVNQTGFTATSVAMAKVTTSSGAVTTSEDWRPIHGPFPYHPVEVDEVGVVDLRFRRGDSRRYGPDATGATDSHTQLQNWLDSCFKSSGVVNGLANASKNVDAFLARGTYQTSTTLLLTQLVGGVIKGAGRFATSIMCTTLNTPVFTTNGCSYSRFSDMRIAAGANSNLGVFELDWDNSSGGAALQSNTFENIYFDANAHTVSYGVDIGRTGYMGSENLFINCFWIDFTVAGLRSSNFNALQNTVLGGNFQGCTKYGILVTQGSINVISVGFQNGGINGAQITNVGYDICIQNSADDCSTIRGCRSESFQFLSNANSHLTKADGCNYTPTVLRWSAGATAVVGQIWSGTATGGDGKLYQCTVGGVMGGVEPTWNGGSVTSGAVTWAYLDCLIVTGGSFALDMCVLPFGRVYAPIAGEQTVPCSVTRCVFSRTDWNASFYGLGNAAGSSHLLMFLNFVRQGGGPNTGGAVQSYRGLDSGIGGLPPYLGSSLFDIGDTPFLFSRGNGGNAYPDVGFVPADKDFSVAARNTLGLIGTLGAPLPAANNAAGTDTVLTGGQGRGTGASGKLRFRVAPAGVSGSTPNAPVDAGYFDDDATAGNTRFLLYDVTAGTVKRVSIGAADSAGSGFKVLRIPN